jgi:hypothetical protein
VRPASKRWRIMSNCSTLKIFRPSLKKPKAKSPTKMATRWRNFARTLRP